MNYTKPELLRHTAWAFRFNDDIDEHDGPIVFQHACKLDLEGIISKRRDTRYVSASLRKPVESAHSGMDHGG
jgi:hypothetical protein